jgi:adenylate kinase family enzyme
VVGSGGAGKTTFARELSRRTGLPVVHLDRHHWKHGWVETPEDEWRAALTAALAGEQWIADGNYAGTFDLRFRRADTIVVLSPSRWRCLGRSLRRTLMNYGRAVQADGCPERIDVKFLKWIWNFPKKSRPLLDLAIAHHGGSATVVELKSTSDVRSFLHRLGQ